MRDYSNFAFCEYFISIVTRRLKRTYFEWCTGKTVRMCMWNRKKVRVIETESRVSSIIHHLVLNKPNSIRKFLNNLI